jgi:hypothetical protein
MFGSQTDGEKVTYGFLVAVELEEPESKGHVLHDLIKKQLSGFLMTFDDVVKVDVESLGKIECYEETE